MPIPLALLVGFSLGCAFAWAARSTLAQTDSLMARPLAVTAAFAGLIYVPMVGYFDAFHGDWAYLYLVPANHVPSAVDLLLVLACGAMILFGFASAAPLARGKRFAPMLVLFGVPALVAAMLALFWQRRLGAHATYTQFEGGFGVIPISRTALGRAVLFSFAVVAAAVAHTVRLLRSAPKSVR